MAIIASTTYIVAAKTTARKYSPRTLHIISKHDFTLRGSCFSEKYRITFCEKLHFVIPLCLRENKKK